MTETPSQTPFDLALMQETASLAHQKYGRVPELLSSDTGTQILTDQETIVRLLKDPLTELDRRDVWAQKTLELIEQYERIGDENDFFVLTLMDLDHFKQINDKHGHTTGDRILRAIGKWLQTNRRKADTLGRYGGDEMIAAGIASHTSKEEILKCFTKQHASLPKEIEGIPTTQSWGLAILSVDEIRELKKQYPDTLLQAIIDIADDLLYQAKQAGRNCLRSNYRPTQDPELTPTPPPPHQT